MRHITTTDRHDSNDKDIKILFKQQNILEIIYTDRYIKKYYIAYWITKKKQEMLTLLLTRMQKNVWCKTSKTNLTHTYTTDDCNCISRLRQTSKELWQNFVDIKKICQRWG